MKRLGGVLLGATVGIVLLAGCSTTTGDGGNTATIGSLGDIADFGHGCNPLTGPTGNTDHNILSGWETLHNTADTPVMVRSVSLTNPHGIRVRWAKLAPILHKTLVGHWRGPWDAHTRDTMAGAYPAIGGTIPARTKLGLILDLAIPHGGSMGPVRVTYTDSTGDTHLWTGGSSFRFPIKSC